MGVTPFLLTAPLDSGARPILVEIPHAGLLLPEDVRPQLLASEGALLRDADIFVDRLYETAPAHGATLLAAQISRYVVDATVLPIFEGVKPILELKVIARQLLAA